MSQSPRKRGDRPPGTESPASDARLILLDDKQWSYLRKRYDLTAREQQIAELVCQGLRTGHIAGCLKIRPGTVKTHIRNIYRKVRVKNKINMLLCFIVEAREFSTGLESAQSAAALE
jgi:DNA-binding CsgD family transcriptional regulator